jgi:predicted acylesterase/phospholipase RssA
VRLAADEWLFREGDGADCLYIVRAGRLEVVDETAGAVIRELGRGDVIGELALLTATPRSASARAARASDLVVLDRGPFDAAVRAAPALSLALTSSLAGQLRDTRAPVSAVRPRPVTVALLALDERVPVDQLARGLVAALPLSADVLEPPPVSTGDPAAAYGPLLDRAESANDLVLLVAGSHAPWRDFCLQQADRIIAASAGGDAVELPPELRGCDLLGYDVAPGQLAGWAERLDPIESHLVRSAQLDEDLARLARKLSGRSLGVVLSGGGARALSHIGVLEELLAAGLEIDRVAGVSMGAFVGALFASGLTIDEIDARCFEEWAQRRPLSDYTLPRHALIRGERLRTALKRTFGQSAIEELPRSFICGATELRSGRLVLFRHGPLFEAVGCSMCLPIIGPPQVHDRDLLIDGSLVDNLPVAAMAEMGEGPIIAVDVKATIDRPVSPSADSDAPPMRVPGLGETIARVLLLGSANTSEAAARHADLVITPRAVGVGLFEFHQLDAAREAGRAAAREALERGITF